MNSRAQPIVTIVLICINLAVFVATMADGIDKRGGIVDLGTTIGAVRLDNGTIGGVAFGEWYRLISGGFLHGGIIHVAMNMYSLWILGQLLEPALGRVRFAALYMTALLAGSFGVMVTAPTNGAVGASGAIFGLFGVTFMVLRSRGVNPWQTSLASVLVINLIITFTIPSISIGGHIGGLLGGFIAGYVVIELDKRHTPPWLPVLACAGMSAMFVIGALFAASQWANPLIDLGR